MTKKLRLFYLPAVFSVVFLFAFFFIAFATHACACGEFVTTWQTDNAGTSDDDQITIPAFVGGSYDVDWGDMTTSSGLSGPATHTFPDSGTYTVVISGDFHGMAFGLSGDRLKLLSVEQWGTASWASMSGAFFGCSNMVINATDTPDLSGVLDMTYAFRNTDFSDGLEDWDVSHVHFMTGIFQDSTFNGDISGWDVSSATNLSALFYEDHDFNQDIGDWDVSSATNLNAMFYGDTDFNQDISGWDVSHVLNMGEMFHGASNFNQPLDSWDVENVLTMQGMFTLASDFNQPIGSWDVSSVGNFGAMFYEADSFNQPLNSWHLSDANSIGAMFFGTDAFNQPLDSWDVSDVTYMGNTFEASAFNQDISSWDMSNVTDIYAMFAHNSHFNQNISAWDTSNITNMDSAFYYATSFDQDLSSWDISNVTNMTDMFSGVTLSTENYDAMLSAWSSLSLQSSVPFDAGNSIYCASKKYREKIVNDFDWTIIDGGISSKSCGRSSGGGSIAKIVLNEQKIENPLPPTINIVPEIKKITKDLKFGMTDVDVKILQEFLVTQNKGPSAMTLKNVGATGYFGPLTVRALAEWQKLNGITPSAGYFGPKTRAFIAINV